MLVFVNPELCAAVPNVQFHLSSRSAERGDSRLSDPVGFWADHLL